MSIHGLVLDCFGEWLENFLINKYFFGNKQLYDTVDLSIKGQNSFNQFIKSEDDIKVKFGGYLEKYLIDKKIGMTVHSEMKVYAAMRSKSDLSVHIVENNRLWDKIDPNPVKESLVAVIEIKYANFRDPDYDFIKGHIQKDVAKLSSLPEPIVRFLLLLDEGMKASEDFVDFVVNNSINNNITVLSNNERFKK